MLEKDDYLQNLTGDGMHGFSAFADFAEFAQQIYRNLSKWGRKGLEGLTPTRFRRNRATEPQAREANLIPKESDSLRVTNSGMVFLRLG